MSDEPEVDPEVGAFQPYVQKATGLGTGPDWQNPYPAGSLRRIRAFATIEEAGVQATTEAVILLHSIRRILMSMLVIVPVAAAALFIALMIMDNASAPASCTSIYTC
ncbi:hypothetical protein SK803_09020 [Lentzea sp. BCCO 10_0856]|uniref:Uncharacterized protein n=1 Tax=Lentzea miocenica TaxID=3095431 RepID=A0ABU4SWT0_9PSEU|nr:hypothetical protein [Lentzea sp. BCCO 10_0856]MDX8030351.1 hypothetical protein [Lentzea sp. BCCO 10_0856]